MTPEQLKKLAEFAVEYLGNKEVTVHLDKWDINAHSLFESNSLAPILMHLAQEKLEKEGFDCEYNQQVGIHLWEFNMSLDYDRPVARAEHKSKFIAFWEAVQEAKGGK